MPVFTHHTQPVADHDILVDELAAELSGRHNVTGEPQVYENQISQTRTVHVIVIWDRWRAVPASERGPIIYDAYEKVDPSRMLRLKFAFGFTYQEAVAGGYLPYKVESMIRTSDPVDPLAVRQEFLNLGARQTPTGLELRYPYQSLADDAINQLESKFGKGYFSLSREVGSVGQWVRA